ncbi:MAG: fibronectin type III domain-containing protein [Clostridia bacterium]|nr:fibronectin type III domain-containing protein [Clostridia bacterium]
MKKTLAVLLSLVMLLALIPAAVAEGEPDFTLVIKGGDVAENLELFGGKQVLAVDVTLNGTVEETICGLTFDLTYDAEQLTYVGNETTDAYDMAMVNDTKEGIVRFTFTSTEGVAAAEDMPIATLYFEVNAELEAGTEIALALADGALAETGNPAAPAAHDIAANFMPYIVGNAVVFNGIVKFNEGEVQYKGETAYVIWDHAAGKHEPAFTVYEEDGTTVVDPANYDYEYKENAQPGTGYLFVYFKGQYMGEARLTFKIYLPATTATTVENVAEGIKITWEPVEDAAGYVIYRRAWSSTTDGWTAFARWDNTTETTYLDGHDDAHKTFAGTRYQYGVKAYFARRTDPIAEAEIGGNVNDPSGNFNLGEVGPLKTTVRITTRVLKSLTAGTKQLTAKWDGSSVFTGYQIQYATNAAFTKGAKSIKISNPKTVQTVLKDLKTGTTYYVRVRSYHEFNGMTYYGQWSNVKNAKVK